MTKFLLFASANYYPCGGLHDCHGAYDTRAETEAAMAEISDMYMGDCHVLQLPEMLVHIYDSERRYVGVVHFDAFLDGD